MVYLKFMCSTSVFQVLSWLLLNILCQHVVMVNGVFSSLKDMFRVSSNARAEGTSTGMMPARSLVECATHCLEHQCSVAQYRRADLTCELFIGMSMDIVSPLIAGTGPDTVLIRSTMPAFYVRHENRHSLSVSEATQTCVDLGGEIATRAAVENLVAEMPFDKETCCHAADINGLRVQANHDVTYCYEGYMEVYCVII